MSRLQATEIKAFVPAQDFAMSTSFYTDLGFTQRSEGGGVACLSVDGCAILLQDFHDAGLADKLMIIFWYTTWPRGVPTWIRRIWWAATARASRQWWSNPGASPTSP